MSSLVKINGYAAPFLQAEHCYGRVECFDPEAFDEMLSRPHSVFLNFADHSGPPVCRLIRLFTDSYGLGFQAWLPAATWRKIGNRVCNGTYQFASVNVVRERIETDLDQGGHCSRIIKATIDHITIANESAVYKGTGVWPADFSGKMTSRLAHLAAKWEIGWQNARAGAARARSAGAGLRPGDRRAAQLLTPYAKRFARQRELIARAFSEGKIFAIASAAFSRAGGFDSNEFMRLVASAGAKGI